MSTEPSPFNFNHARLRSGKDSCLSINHVQVLVDSWLADCQAKGYSDTTTVS